MTEYSHKGKRNILLWDGMDDGVTKETYKMACPLCGDESNYSMLGLDSLDAAPNDLDRYVSDAGIVSEGEIKKDMPAYIVKHECKNCHKPLWRIVGLREIQPARYKIYYKSTVFKAE